MADIKSWLGKQIKGEATLPPVIVTPRHDVAYLNQLTKKQVIDYAHKYGIAVISRKKKDEIIDIIMRT